MEDLTPQDVKDRMNNGEDLNLLDVREEWEHEEYNIGGTLIPLGSLPHRLEELEHLKDQEVIVYCRTGNRSGQAKLFLTQQGFSNVKNLQEGTVGYQNLDD